MTATHLSAVVGLFYPADAHWLGQEVEHLLDTAAPHGIKLKARIVPHAGYIYSAPVAASAYAALATIAHAVTRVVLLGSAAGLGKSVQSGTISCQIEIQGTFAGEFPGQGNQIVALYRG